MLTGPLPPPPGDPPKSTGDAAAMLLASWEAAAPDVIATAVLLARRGDMGALRMILDRIAPVKGRTIKLDIPPLRTVADVPAINKRLIELVASGLMTAEEAGAMSSVLANYVAATDTADVLARLEAAERALAETGQ
jgi:hypothetical protein